jgi:glycogen debranching enzyme
MLADQATASFTARFWNEETGCLHDVVDVDHVAGTVDPSIRPNQLLAVGGLPWSILTGDRARRVVEVCAARLWTPAGPRSLAPQDAAFLGRYEGDMRARDAAYHQGTVWPWMAGAFIEAWLRVHGDIAQHRADARRRFLEPLLAHYQASAPGQVGEIADGDAPHRPNGCPFQAWSVGEALRLSVHVLRTGPEGTSGDDRRSPKASTKEVSLGSRTMRDALVVRGERRQAVARPLREMVAAQLAG